MKLYNILLLFCFALLLTSCITSPDGPPQYDSFVCCINADGTGFQKLISISQLPFEISKLWDLYTTKNGKLIFAADKYYISEPDTIAPVPFIDIRTNFGIGMTLSNDDKAYICSNGDLFKYDFQTHNLTNLTDDYHGYLMNPRISNDDSIITMIQKDSISYNPTTLCYYKLLDSTIHLLPEGGLYTQNGIYSPSDNRLYHEQNNGLYRINLNGENNEHLLSYSPLSSKSFNLTFYNDNLILINLSNLLSLYDINSGLATFTHQLDAQNEINVKCTKNANRIYYTVGNNIFYHNLDDQTSFKVPNTSGREFAMCPTWDGNKIYYIANLRINK